MHHADTFLPRTKHRPCFTADLPAPEKFFSTREIVFTTVESVEM
jgi:hypothetical protein